MRIDAPSEDTIIVELTSTDLSELDITYDEMDYSNIETRRVIWTLLDTARQTLGRDIDPSGQLKIEAVPDGSGGCVLFIAMHAGDKTVSRIIKKAGTTLTLETDSLECLMDFAKSAAGLDSDDLSELYVNKNQYRLLMQRRDSICHAAAEYMLSTVDGKAAAEKTREHWRCLAPKNALTLLCGGERS